MQKLKRLIASLSTVAIVSTLVMSSAFAAYTDLTSDWYKDSVKSMVDAGILQGEGNFNPTTELTRADAADWLVRGAGHDLIEPETPTFKDVPVAHTEYKAIETAAHKGFVEGRRDKETKELTGYFAPARTVSRQEFAKMAVEAYGFEKSGTCEDLEEDFQDTDEIASWACEYVATAVKFGVIEGRVDEDGGKPFIAPKRLINRAAGAVMVDRSKDALPEEVVECADGETLVEGVCTADEDVVVVVTEGDVTVTLSIDSPSGSTIPSQAAGVLVAAFDFEAGSEDAIIEELMVTQSGVGESSNFEGLYLYNEAGERLTNRRSINSDTRAATFSNINVEIAAGETVTLYVKADMAAVVTASEARFSIDSSDDVVVGGAAGGSYPVSGALFGVSATAAGTLTVTKSGTVSDPTIGAQGAKIAEFRLESDGEDAYIQQLSLTVEGGIDADSVTNLELKDSDGDVIATSEEVTSEDLAVFVFDDEYKIDDGGSRVFRVYADLTGEATEDIKVFFDVDADILALGGDYHFGMNIVRTAYDGDLCTTSAGDCSYSTLEGGDVTITNNGPSAQDVSLDGDDVILLEFAVTSFTSAELQEFKINVYADDDDDTDTFDGGVDGGADADGLINDMLIPSEANLTSVKIINTESGSTVMSSQELSTAGSDAVQTLTFDDPKMLVAGETLYLAVVADLTDELGFIGESIGAELDISSVVIEDNNGDTVAATEIVPSTDVTGNEMTVVDAELFISMASSPSSDTVIKGMTEVAVLGTNFRAGDSEDITLTQLTVTCKADVDGDGYDDLAQDFISSVSLYNGGELLEGPEGVGLDGTSIFEDIDLTITAGTTEKITAYVDLNNASGVTSDLIACGIELTTDVIAQDESGNSVGNDVTVSGGFNPINSDQTVIMTIEDAGTLSYRKEGGPSSSLVMGGMDDVLVSKYKFSAINESFTVKKLQLWTAVSGAQVLDATYSSAYSNIKLGYFNEAGEAVVTSVGAEADGSISVSGLDFFVEKGEDSFLEIFVDVQDVNSGANTGDEIRVLIDVTANNATNPFEARGINTMKSDDANLIEATNNASIEGHLVRNTLLSIAKVADSELPSVLVNANENMIYGVEVSADSNDSVELREIKFNVSESTTGVLNTLKIFRGSTELTTATITTSVGGDAVVTGDEKVIVTFVDEYISKGTSNKYFLQAVATSVVADGESVSVSILDDSSAVNPFRVSDGQDTLAVDQVMGGMNIIWSDNADESHSDTSYDWHNGYLVDSLSTGVFGLEK